MQNDDNCAIIDDAMSAMITWLLGLLLLLQPLFSAVLPAKPKAQPEQQILSVRFHPDGFLEAGDLVSFEVFAPPGEDYSEITLEVTVDDGQGTSFGPLEFQPDPIGRQYQAEAYWVWDTSSLSPGEYQMQFKLLPGGLQWHQTVTLAARPTETATQSWQHVETSCCNIHYITGTAAERDLNQLVDLVDQQAQRVEERLGITFTDRVAINFIPRVIGHGGFTTDQLYISYLDRNYAGTNLAIVLFHELTHMLDRQIESGYRPSMFVEGIAVFLSGGHFKHEVLAERAAALLTLDLYIPFDEMIENFYATQHEAGYLQAGALVEFMAAVWGKTSFFTFYRDIQLEDGSTPEKAINQALQRHFKLTLPELENRFLSYLHQLNPTSAQVDDVRLTVTYFDTVRRYQQRLDPSAYFREAWLPAADAMRKRGIVADYARWPDHPENYVIEKLLAKVWGFLAAGQYRIVEILLRTINRVLDAIPVRQPLYQLEGAEVGAAARLNWLNVNRPHACAACGLP
jgi:hypothetical protein